MNLGLVVQNLAGAPGARITDAISAYQRALRTFDRARFPKEFAILQNNLATAFLSMPFTDERAKMREALAVQAFEEGLKVVNLIDHPAEYAMLQNNLGNALQYASSSHTVENNLRALDAYDEALQGAHARRDRRSNTPTPSPTTPIACGTCRTIPSSPEPAIAPTCALARRPIWRRARSSSAHGELEKARIVAEASIRSSREHPVAAPPANGDARPS